jgi:tetratricopeptide (TPR) repeat protein
MERNLVRHFADFARGVVLALVLVGTVAAKDEHTGHALGVVSFPISCSPEAQTEFNRAVALLHHMTYPQARAAFEQVAQIDPTCAMAHWGVAMTLFQPLWPTRPSPKGLERGWEEVQQAKKLKPPTERERLFVAATDAFFLEPKENNYWLRIRRWEQAMEKLYRAFPDDHEVEAFYALAHLAVAPANSISRANSDRAAEILLRLYKENPQHPGAMHYLVHANDVPGRERESLEITRKYEQIAPDNPHALHMPTHIYTRLGDWDGVVRGNLRAAEAALKYPAGEHGEFVWDEFPHAIEYLIYAYLQQGADNEAARQLKRLRETPALEPSFKTAFHLASTQSRWALERRDWKAAIAISPREPASLDWDRFAWPEAIARFAHGLGAIHTGQTSEAEIAVTRLLELEERMTAASEDLFARNIRVLRLELSGWIAHAQNNDELAMAKLREAAELEASTPKHAVTPGPTLPADEQLGELLMEVKRPAEALTAYKRSLDFYPRRFNGLLGAARAARATNDKAAALAYYKKLIEVAGQGQRQTELEEARHFVADSA